MISDTLIQFAYNILTLLLGLFPLSAGYPPQVASAFTWLGGYFQMLSPIIPITTFGTVVTLYITVELLIFGFKFAQWIYSKIPFIGR